MQRFLAGYGELGQGISFRSYLPDAQTLTAYYPPMSKSPLMNATTARIFCHFIYVLGPSISIFERHAPNPAMVFSSGAGSRAPQNVWTYTIPMLALSHPPLQHAILAVSSLHIAKLTKGSNNASRLHYSLAIKRLGKALSDDRKRRHVATLAATLLLAYFETMSAEHEKWTTHIVGAKQLLREIDFDNVSKRIEALDDEERANEQFPQQPASTHAVARNQRLMMRAARKQRDAFPLHTVDENLRNYIMGTKVAQRRESNAQAKVRAKITTKKDLETCQLQSDLFWWFAKMDVYQAILSGAGLV